MKFFAKTTNKKIIKTQKANFSFLNKFKRHLDALVEPGNTDYSSSMIDTNLSMYSNMRQFQAYLTKNAYDMSIYNEYDLWPHTNFGTIDNPLIIFSADTTWRLIICTGPGSEEESSMHEKMYMIVREGPIHRCSMCGQCFKLHKLKDSLAEPENYYYSSVFTEINQQFISEIELAPYFATMFMSHDLNTHQSNIVPNKRSFLIVNADEADHIMVDPAYRMAKYKDIEEDFGKLELVQKEIENQAKQLLRSDVDKILIPMDVFETWIEVEKAILGFDREFNRYEKFEGRALFDRENNDRRERRMVERYNQRHKDNFTYYFGNNNEFNQMFRDYYESDVEETDDLDYVNKLRDEDLLRNSEDFHLGRYEFTESTSTFKEREAVDDYIGKSIFKYKYRSLTDPKFETRNRRLIERFIERAQNRSPELLEDLGEKLEMFMVKNKFNTDFSLNEKVFKDTDPFLNYVAEEGWKQFHDYFETDEEEGKLKREMFDDLNNRDKLRFVECYENELTKDKELDNAYVSIPKRPFDYNKTVFRNFVDDLLDFNNRVRPIVRSLIFQDAASKYQVLPLNDKEVKVDRVNNDRYRKVLNFKKNEVTSKGLREISNKI
jgi:hypothetical protein